METGMDDYVNKVEESLSSIGIKLRSKQGEFRDMLDVFGDISKVWKGLNDEQQSNLMYNMAGVRQSNVLRTLFNNWDEYKDLVSKAMGAEGTTLETQAIYADSLQGKLSKLKAVWFEIANKTISSDGLKSVLDVATQLSEKVSEIGLLPSILGALGGFGLLKTIFGGGLGGLLESFQLLGSLGELAAVDSLAEGAMLISGALPGILAVVAALTLMAKALDDNSTASFNAAGALKALRKLDEKYKQTSEELNQELQTQTDYRNQLLKIAEKYKDDLKAQGIEIKDTDDIDDIINKLNQLSTLSKEDYDIISKIEMDNTALEERIALLERELELTQQERSKKAQQLANDTSSSYDKYFNEETGQIDVRRDKNRPDQAASSQRTEFEQALQSLELQKQAYDHLNKAKQDSKKASEDYTAATKELTNAQKEYDKEHNKLYDDKGNIKQGVTDQQLKDIASFKQRISDLKEAQKIAKETAESSEEYYNNVQESYKNQKAQAQAIKSELKENYDDLVQYDGFIGESDVDTAKELLRQINEIDQIQQGLKIQEAQDFAKSFKELGDVNLDFDLNSMNLKDARDTIDGLIKARDGLQEGTAAYNALDQVIKASEKEYTLKFKAEADIDGIDQDLNQIKRIASEQKIDTGNILDFNASKMSVDEIGSKIKELESIKASFDIEGQEKIDELISKLQEEKKIKATVEVEEPSGGGAKKQQKLAVNVKADITNDVNAEIQSKIDAQASTVTTDTEVKVNPIVSFVGGIVDKIKSAIGKTKVTTDATVNSTQNSTVNYTVGSKPSPGELNVNAKADYTLGTTPKSAPAITGVANYVMGVVPTQLPNATQHVTRIYDNYSGTAQTNGIRIPSYASGTYGARNFSVPHDQKSLVNELG